MVPSNVMLNQTQIAPTNAYASMNHSSSGSLPPPPPPSSDPSTSTGQQQPTLQFVAGQAVLHAAGHVMATQPQTVYVDSSNLAPGMPLHNMDQNLRVIGVSSPSSRTETNDHVVSASSSQSATTGSVMPHTNISRSMIPPSSSPLSSPSSSSEHSLIQHGPQPVPSAPSATSTPQPEEKEEIAELISFD